jgi:hypothetical protein
VSGWLFNKPGAGVKDIISERQKYPAVPAAEQKHHDEIVCKLSDSTLPISALAVLLYGTK